jgi:hypothetical protein
MTEKMDKSLEDIITEQRTKPKPRVRSGDRTEGAARGSDRRNARPDSRRETKSDVGRKQVAAGPPPREPQYYMVSIHLGLLLLLSHVHQPCRWFRAMCCVGCATMDRQSSHDIESELPSSAAAA